MVALSHHSTARARRVLSHLVAWAMLVVACGPDGEGAADRDGGSRANGGEDAAGSPGTDDAGTSMADGGAAPVAVPKDTPVLFIKTVDDTSRFVAELGDEIESTAARYIMFAPETGEAALVAKNSSVSFARSTSVLPVLDDRVFFLASGGQRADWEELDLDDITGPPRARAVISRGMVRVLAPCFVVIGDALFYKAYAGRTPFPGMGYRDGGLWRVKGFLGSSPQEERLIDGSSGDAPSEDGFVSEVCYDGMDWADGVWYDQRTEADGVTTFYTRDVETGAPSVAGTLTLDGPVKFAFDEGFAYWTETEGGENQIWRTDFEGDPQLVHSAPSHGTSFGGSVLDADDGYVAAFSEEHVWLYDPDSGTSQELDMGVRVNNLWLMVRGE